MIHYYDDPNTHSADCPCHKVLKVFWNCYDCGRLCEGFDLRTVNMSSALCGVCHAKRMYKAFGTLAEYHATHPEFAKSFDSVMSSVDVTSLHMGDQTIKVGE